MNTSQIAASIALVASISTAGALYAREPAKRINPWQHCGIGAAIFDDNPTAAALSNVIWDSGTTAVTSATLTPGACTSKDLEIAQFINHSYDALVVETARGDGEHLRAALDIMSVAVNDRFDVISSLRSDLKVLASDDAFTSMTHADKAYTYYAAITKAAGQEH